MKIIGSGLWTSCLVLLLHLAATASAQTRELPSSQAWPRPGPTDVLLDVQAFHDIPAEVTIQVDAKSLNGNILRSQVLRFPDGNNGLGTKSMYIPLNTYTLRLTYINDYCGPGCPGDPDQDRNAHIDLLALNNGTIVIQGEDFDRTDGTDPAFPGCETDQFQGVDVATCGNEEDWVEYDLPPLGMSHGRYGLLQGTWPGWPGVRNGSAVNPNGFSQSRPAIVGMEWLGTVRLEGAEASLLILGSGPTHGLVTSMGEVLIEGPFMVEFGAGTHAVPIPDDPRLAGTMIWAQAATLGADGIRLTNALDIRIGLSCAEAAR